MAVTAAQLRSLPALYGMRPCRYQVARRILQQTAPVTLLGLTWHDLQNVQAGAQAAGRSVKRHYQPAIVPGFGRDHSGCLTVW